MSPTIDITWPHKLSQTDLRAAIERVAIWQAKEYPTEWSWKSGQLVFRITGGLGRGINGTISPREKVVQLHVNLPLMAQCLDSVIKSGIEERLAIELGPRQTSGKP